MKLLRILIGGLAALLALGFALVLVAFDPRAQTWIVRRALASRPSLHASVGFVSAGLTSLRMDDLRIARGGAVLTAPSVRAELPLLSVFMGHKVRLRRLDASGWTLDLTRARGPVAESTGSRPRSASGNGLFPEARADDAVRLEPAPAGAIFDGVLSRLRLPVDLAVDAADLRGEVILPPPAAAGGLPAAPVHVRVSLAGGGLESGREGRFAVELKADGVSGVRPSVEAAGDLEATMDSPRSFGRLSLHVDASASGSQLSEPVRLTADATTMRTAAGEDATLALAGGGKRLAVVQANFPSAARPLTGTWMLDLADEDLRPFSFGRTLPRFSVSGSGRFDTDLSWTRVAASGRLSATADRLAILGPAFGAVGPLRLTAEFSLALRQGDLRVDRLAAAIAGAQPIADVDALQPFEFDAESGALKVAEPGRPLLGITLADVPVAWARPFLPAGWSASAAALTGSFDAEARGGGLALRARSPLTVSGLTLVRRGETLVEGLDATLSVAADYTPTGWQVKIASAAFSRRGKPVARGGGRFGRLAGPGQDFKVIGSLEASLPELLAVPAFTSVQGWVGRGTVKGAFAATFAGPMADLWSGRRSLELKLSASDVALGGPLAVLGWVSSRQPATVFPPAEGAPAPGLGIGFSSVRADFRTDFDAAGRGLFQAPLIWVSNGVESKLALTGSFERDRASSWSFDAQVAGGSLGLRDVELIGSALALAAASPSQLQGRLAFRIDSISGAPVSLRACTGSARLQPGRLELGGWTARVNDAGKLQFDGRLTANPAETALEADVAVRDFDAGSFFSVLYPGRPPALDGKVDATARIEAESGSLGELASRLQGSLRLTSKAGTFRALRADVATSLRRSPGLLSEFMGAFMSLLPGKTDRSPEAQRYLDKQGRTVVEIADLFREVSYDQLDVAAERDADGRIRITQFALIAPELRIAGQGRIGWEDREPLAEQQVSLDLRLGARGRTADLMGQVGLLGRETDDLGYARCTQPVHLAGTVSRLDDSQWRAMLVRAAAKKAAGGLGLLDKIF